MIEMTGGWDKAVLPKVQAECLLLQAARWQSAPQNRLGKPYLGLQAGCGLPNHPPDHCGGVARRMSSVWAILTRSARDFAAIFLMICPRCIFTVISAIPILAAICLFMSPDVTRAIISRSRAVRVAKCARRSATI